MIRTYHLCTDSNHRHATIADAIRRRMAELAQPEAETRHPVLRPVIRPTFSATA